MKNQMKIDRGYTLEPSTHDLCFRAKIRKIIYTPVNPSFFYIKVGCNGVFVPRTCFRDYLSFMQNKNDDSPSSTV